MARERSSPRASSRAGRSSRGTTGAARAREPAPSYLGLPSVWRAADTPERPTPLLLDTHVWLWLLDGTPGALTSGVRRVIELASSQQRLFVSDFSFWEVAILVAKGRLELSTDVHAWLEQAATAPGIQCVPLSRSLLIRSTTLAGDPHGDPAERILLASAQAIGAALLTCDRGIIAYAKRTPGVAVCDARG